MPPAPAVSQRKKGSGWERRSSRSVWVAGSVLTGGGVAAPELARTHGNGVGGGEKKGEEGQLKMEMKVDAKIGGGIGFGMVGPAE
ncbi:hypothetical protein PR202_ga25200 [Eleusine coracana subsp. coracana]|uniref:Uncharacterized protein n=1 Tax=Eleusine coracana subsp. coracana TaxID=191504 RepID=A0AAV5DBL1_ELECO|nr:hypothetical protein PR202_ga25200 [Eleusine coracana subsp. coracana]